MKWEGGRFGKRLKDAEKLIHKHENITDKHENDWRDLNQKVAECFAERIDHDRQTISSLQARVTQLEARNIQRPEEVRRR